MIKINRQFPFYHQPDIMDCGPTCLQMIARHYGRSYTVQTLRDRCNITRAGVSMLGISEAAESIGFRSMGVKILSPGKLFTSASRYLIRKTRKHFRARAGIEPVIGHLKRDHRMWRNFLLDKEEDKFNTILAALTFFNKHRYYNIKFKN